MVIKLKELYRTCYACPSQWEGITEDGSSIYVRYRFGVLNVDIEINHEWETIFYENVGESYCGVMSFSGLKENTKDYFMWPEFETISC